ncbi:uncharacterized protein LOC132735711 isoform X2 [Ruditapes philippinarum]|uniref:uncharacterized protein LOC132735711 isoform X2 n=1 Tax=Ruditapes philippinarum TaxID=129788 RepID=UPI00295BED5F|nr:uncharacterized protein LOC132735711 isoform X2 [Ruditapes philippinarum]
MGKRGARFYPPAEKPALPNKNEVGFTTNATNRENKMELYGPPNGIHMKGDIIIIVTSGGFKVVFISMVACETGMSTRLWMVCSAAADSIFGVGIIAMLIKMISIAQRQGTKLIRDAVSEIFLVVPVRIAYLYFNQSFLGKVRVTMISIACVCFQTTRRHVYINEDKWKLPVENIVFQNEGGHSVGNPAVTRCTETDQMTCAEFPREETFEQDVNSVNGSESSSKYNVYLMRCDCDSDCCNFFHPKERILSESQIERSFGNNATIDFPISDVSKKIGYIKQKLCQHILLESTQQEDWLHLNGCVLGYIPEIASCKDRDQMTCAEFPREETFEQDVNSVNGSESSSKYNVYLMRCDCDPDCCNFFHPKERILSESQIERSFGNNATIDFPISDVSKKIGYTKQKICQHILLESTQQEDWSHLNGCVSGYIPEIASCKDRDSVNSQISLEVYENDLMDTDEDSFLAISAEEINTEHVEQDLWKWSHLDKTYGENTQRNCVAYPTVRSCTEIDSVISQTSLEIYENDIMETDQMTCAEFPREETFEQDVNYHSSGHLSVTGNESCKQNDSKRLDWYSEQSDGKDHPDSKVKENEDDLCSRETIKCQLDRVEEWLISNDFERMNTDIDDYTGCGEHEFKPFENSITQCNKECKCEKISKDKAITDISCLTRSCSNIKAKSLNKDNDSGQLDSFPDAHPLHDRSKANLHEHFETHAKIKGNFQTNPLHCISITPKTESMLYPQESQRDSNETKTIASSSRKSNSLQNISNNESKHKIKTSLLDTNPAPLTLPDPFHRDVLVVV